MPSSSLSRRAFLASTGLVALAGPSLVQARVALADASVAVEHRDADRRVTEHLHASSGGLVGKGNPNTRRQASGSSTRKRAPRPGVESTWIAPPWLRTIW